MYQASAEISFDRFAESLASPGGLDFRGQFIDGEWRESTGGSEFAIISPTTEEPIAHMGAASSADVDAAVQAARAALRSKEWASMELEERIAIVERVCGRLEQEADWIGRVQTEQMGAPISASRVNAVHQAVGNMRSSARSAQAIRTRFSVRDDGGITLVDRRPVGVVGAIVPWNSPIGFAADKVGAALLSGSTVVLKAAPETPLEAFVLAELFAQAGLPAGVLNVIAGGGDVGEMLVSHPNVARITFTGSSVTGKRIAGICASRLARVSLELGGKSAAIVLDDADFDRAATAIAGNNFGNSGQGCFSVTRALVPADREAEFLDRVRAIAESLVVGDPREEKTQMGPVVAERQRTRIQGYITLAREAGATVAVGGGSGPMTRGWFVEPTVLTDMTNDMRTAREEIFGPVMSVIRYHDEDEAIAIANDSEYGLGGAVFSADSDHAIEVARQIDTGVCFINGSTLTRNAPFGGVKDSGIGREHGLWGVDGNFEIHAIRPDPRFVADDLLPGQEAALPGARA